MSRSIYHRRRAPAGAAPGAFVLPPDAAPPLIHVIRYDGESLSEHEPTTAPEARALVRPGGVTWIDVKGLGDGKILAEFGELFGLHRLAIADVANSGQRPKVEDYGEVLFCVVRMVTAGEGGVVHWEQFSLFLGKELVVTFQERSGDCLDPLRRRLRDSGRAIRQEGADYLACMILDAIVDGYFPILEKLGETMEDLESRVVESPEPSTLGDVYRVKRELMTFRRAVWPLRDTFSQLLRDGHDLLSERTIPYVRDAADHVFQAVDVVETYRELAGSFVDVYLSSVANRTNDVMRVLTVLATIFIPLTFLAGVYGMNFDTASPFNMPELRWRYGYLVFWGVALLMGIGMLAVFRSLGWLGGRRRRGGERGGDGA